MEARRATVQDVDELVRLRQVMYDALVGSHDTRGGWQAAAAERYRTGLAAGSVGAFVVDGPDGGLIAGGVGTVAQRLPGPGNSPAASGSCSRWPPTRSTVGGGAAGRCSPHCSTGSRRRG